MTAPYVTKVLSYSPIVYYPLNETTGAVATNQGTLGAAANGTAVAVTWDDMIGPDGVNGAPFFDGATSYVNIFSAAFDAAFSGATGTLLLWCRVANVGVWTDATGRYVLNLMADGNNTVRFRRPLADNQFQYQYEAGAVAEDRLSAGLTTTDWFCLGMTWGAVADEVRYYWHGAWLETDTALGVWAGALAISVIGAYAIVPTSPWHGWLAHVAVWDSVLTSTQILDLAEAVTTPAPALRTLTPGAPGRAVTVAAPGRVYTPPERG